MPADERAQRRRERRLARRVWWGALLVRLLGRTWRIHVRHDDDVRRLRAMKQPIVFTLWHGQMLPLLYHHRNEGIAVLISEHADGELIARVAARLGYDTVRGSTTRGAARALVGLLRTIEAGSDLAITPDGPRGPARSIAPGSAIVAQRSGAPLIACGVHADRAWRLRSWDGFMIPHPFARVEIAYSDAVQLAAQDAREGADAEEDVRRAMVVAEERARG